MPSSLHGRSVVRIDAQLVKHLDVAEELEYF